MNVASGLSLTSFMTNIVVLSHSKQRFELLKGVKRAHFATFDSTFHTLNSNRAFALILKCHCSGNNLTFNKLTHLSGSRCKSSRMFLRRQYVMGTFSTSHHRANRGGSRRRPSPGQYSAAALVRTNTSTVGSRRLVDRKLRRGRDGVGLQ